MNRNLALAADQTMNIPQDSGVEDNTTFPDRRAKKRIQNRVAQRSYRQRMKARVQELEAKVDMLEGSRPTDETTTTVESRSTSRSPVSRTRQGGTHEVSDLPECNGDSRSPSPFDCLSNANPTFSSLQSEPQQPLHSFTQPALKDHIPMFDSTFGDDMQMDTTGGVQLEQLHLQSSSTIDSIPDYFNYPSDGPQRLATSNMPIAVDLDPYNTQSSSSTSLTSHSNTTSSGTNSSVSDLLPTLHYTEIADSSWHADVEMGRYAASNRQGVTEMPIFPLGSTSGTGVQLDSLQYVTEQAKALHSHEVGVGQIKAPIAANGNGDPAHLEDNSNLRRVPKLIALMRQAAAEWQDWERSGFPLD